LPAGNGASPPCRTHVYASDAGFPSGIAGSFERLACGRGSGFMLLTLKESCCDGGGALDAGARPARPVIVEADVAKNDFAWFNRGTGSQVGQILSGEIVFEAEKFRVRGNRAGELLQIWLICIAGAEMREKMKSIVRMRLNLTIAPGTFLGVSGPTGAGKTTLADLLIGLLEPDSGDIAVGGAPLRGAAAIKWRDHVSYVVQDPYLFRDTIRRNLLWANPQAKDAEVWDALAIAGVNDFVASLPAGLYTVLGERGTLISGGERQRLCLARAVLRRPFLFVLDEATSAIDVPAERKIIKAMLDLKPRPTIVMIAHREQSLDFCDRMVRLQNSRAVADEPALVS
jgi:ABC-type multidrug transport system fused ATPase/permease subunit